MRKARSFIRRTVASMGPIEAKRFNVDKLAIPAKSAADYDNPLVLDLLVCQESIDEEVESDGTTVAQVPLYSKLVGMKGQLMIHGASNGDVFRWLLYKNTDNDDPITSLTNSFFHTSNDDQTSREIRSRIMAKGMFVATDKLGSRLNLFVRRKTLKRLGSLRENDRITLLIAHDDSASKLLTGFGTLYCRLN